MSLATEKIDALSGVDKEDARGLLESWQALEQNGSDPDEREGLLADFSAYGITETDLTPRDESVKARPLTRKEKAALRKAEAAPEPEPEPEPADNVADADVVEEEDGQTALATGDPILLTTEVRGSRPSKGQIKIGSFKRLVDHDLQPGDGEFMLVRTLITQIDGLGSDTRVHVAEVTDIEPLGEVTTLSAQEAIDAVRDAKTRAQRDRAVIDHAVQLLEEVWEDAPETVVDGAVELRRRLYEMYKVDDDAAEVQKGTPDHDDGWDDEDED